MSARDWLADQGRRLWRASVTAVALVALGGAAAMLAAGPLVERVLPARVYPELVLLPWLAAVIVAGAIVWRLAPRVRAASPAGVGASVEHIAGLRRGELAGLAQSPHGSITLAAFADRRMANWLAEHGPAVARRLAAVRHRTLVLHACAAAGGLALLAGAGALAPGAEVWRPVAALRDARAPVRLTVDRTRASRGDSVIAGIEAIGRTDAVLHARRAGEEWTATPVTLVDGRATRVLGPLDADLELVAVSGRRQSDTVRVAIHAALFVADLSVTAHYPAYLERPDEPIDAGGDTVLVPVGTRLTVEGRASLPLRSAAWTDREGRRVPLETGGAAFRGGLTVTRSADWTLALDAADSVPLAGAPASLTLVAVPDAAPAVSFVVPSGDTVMPTTLVQPLVVDVRDDHRVVGAEVVSRRVSRLGTASAAVTETVPLPADGIERGVLAASLDLNHRGFLPGDTAYVQVRVWDNAPRAGVSATPEIRLRLPSLADLRAAVRDEAAALQQVADSLTDTQRAIERSAQDLARERQRPDSGVRGAETRPQMGFEQAQRAGALGAEQRDVLKRAEQLKERLTRLDQTAWDAGLTDPELHKQLADLRRLLDQALTPELEAALRDLERAVDQLDPEATREALQRLADMQAQLRRELERSRELFERAALEGQLTTLADDAAELAARQQEWNRSASQDVDSAAARAEQQLAERTDSLGARLDSAARALAERGAQAGDSSAARAAEAARQMRQAAQAAAQGRQAEAARAGGRASEQLDPIAGQLTGQRDAMREAWRQEVASALDAALTETAGLARRQADVNRRLERGESGADVRAAEAATQEGLDRVLARIQDAAGKNALVPPTLGAALGYARNRMGEALDQLQQGNPNTRAAADAAGEALDGLNALAMRLLRSRGDVTGAQSGSGLTEAVQRMAQLANQQGQMAGQSGGMLPLMQSAGQAMMQELQQLARQQRALAAELRRMQAQGDQPGAGALADEAEQIARTLDAGVLTRETVERQERLYRRLLDAGRLLRGPEADENKERQSTTARQDNVLLPTGPRRADAGPRFRYPTWQELQGLSPADRRAVLEYFRALNDARRP